MVEPGTVDKGLVPFDGFGRRPDLLLAGGQQHLAAVEPLRADVDVVLCAANRHPRLIDEIPGRSPAIVPREVTGFEVGRLLLGYSPGPFVVHTVHDSRMLRESGGCQRFR